MMDFRVHIPNFFTILNLLSGSLSLLLLFRGMYVIAAFLIILSAIFDFLDGFTAKLLNAKSLIGKELDSLADVISFGLVPALFLYIVMTKNAVTFIGSYAVLPYLALLIGAFSALRLAKFNLDTRQSVNFLGLPTPANAVLIISFTMITLSGENNVPLISSLASNIWFQVLLIPVSCYLLVSEIPMFSLKFSKGFSFGNNKIKYFFLAFLLLATALFQWSGIAISIILYILLSLMFTKK